MLGRSEQLLHLVVLDVRVLLLNALLVGREVVERAVVRLRVAMLGAEDEGALALHLEDADLLAAFPALVLVLLHKFLWLWCLGFLGCGARSRRLHCGSGHWRLNRLLLLHLFVGGVGLGRSRLNDWCHRAANLLQLTRLLLLLGDLLGLNLSLGG